jgi:hypothetical protein
MRALDDSSDRVIMRLRGPMDTRGFALALRPHFRLSGNWVVVESMWPASRRGVLISHRDGWLVGLEEDRRCPVHVALTLLASDMAKKCAYFAPGNNTIDFSVT